MDNRNEVVESITDAHVHLTRFATENVYSINLTRQQFVLIFLESELVAFLIEAV